MAALSTYELSRLDNMAQNRRKLTCLGLVREPAAHKKQARRRAAAPEAATRASVRRTEAPPRRYDTLHLFGRDVAEWPLPGVQRSHTLLVVRLVVRGLAVARGHAGQARARPSRLAAAAAAGCHHRGPLSSQIIWRRGRERASEKAVGEKRKGKGQR